MTQTDANGAASRASIIARARKLAQMTQAQGATEAEATTAAQMLARLMAEHDIRQDEMSIRQEAAHMTTDDFIEMAKAPEQLNKILPQIARLFGTRYWYERKAMDPLGLGIFSNVVCHRFFGMAADVVASVALTSIMYNAVAAETDRYAAKLPKGRQKGQKAKKQLLIDSFQYGLIERLIERIKQLQPPKPTQSTGTALVVLKDQLVTKGFQDLGLNLQYHKARTMMVDPAAHAQGRARGDSVGIPGREQTMTHHSNRQLEGNS